MRHLLPLIVLFVLAAPAAADVAPAPTGTAQSAADHPGGRWDGALLRPAVKAAEPHWSLRTGFRKGVLDQVYDSELFAGPDAAVLRRGAFAEATGLLAEYRESAVLVEPADVAALASTKPYLVIPSGGLAGFASSAFARAGLAEYARSGGVILCFAQQAGGDYAALPVPDGAKLDAAGWNEDSGPLLRASMVQARHPALAGMKRPLPSVETHGYLRTIPDTAHVLLARPDGFSTLILYPFGTGWVVVTTLFSDHSHAQGLLEQDEKVLVRDLLLWAKSGGRMAEVGPGGQFRSALTVRGPEQGASAHLRTLVLGTQHNQVLNDRTFPLVLKSEQTGSVPFQYALPADIPPGIYRVEYLLLDENRRPVTPQVESSEGWFTVLSRSAPAPAIVRSQQPLPAPLIRIAALPRIEQAGDRQRIDLDVTKTAGPPGPYELVLRAAGHERSFKITKDSEKLSMDVPSDKAGRAITYALSLADGRTLVRGNIAESSHPKTGIYLDRPWYLPGQSVRVSVKGMGPGAITVTGLGTVLREHTSKDRTFEMTVPQTLPEGTYPLAWEFETRSGARKEGEVPVPVLGARAVCTGVTVARRPEGKDPSLAASLRISASHGLDAVLRLQPVGPDGKELPGQERSVTLAAGSQDIDLSLPFTANQAGIWLLRHTLTVRLAEGPGFSADPVTLSSGQTLFDVGDAVVLGMSTDKPVYNEASGTVRLALLLHGNGAVKTEVSVDGKRVHKGSIDARGTVALAIPLSGLAPGPHTVKAVAASNDRTHSREIGVLYGARLPDLAASVKTGELSAPLLEIGVGITNQGKVSSGHVDASLYEGDPDRGGKLIQTVPVPPLAPGKQHVFLVKWPLAGKAGQRALVAVIDRDNKAVEAGKGNNRATVNLAVPPLQLSLLPERQTYRAGEPVRYQVKVINYAAEKLTGLSVDLTTADPAGMKVSSETVPVGDLAPGDERTIDRTLSVPAPREGFYLVSAVATAGTTVESDSLGLHILPTLLLKGSFEGTPAVAASCRPFPIRYQVRDAGNVPPTNGTLKLEVRSQDQKQLVYAQQIPFALGPGTHRLDKLDLPRGAYSATIRASAVNQHRGLTGEFPLADLPFTVAGPVEVKRAPLSYPRVLVWHDKESATMIERAVVEKLLKEAFPRDSVLLKTVSSPEEFMGESLSGRYNVYLLLDVDAAPDTAEVLRHGLSQGRGIILAGSKERAQSLAEAMGFRFGSPLPGSGSSMTFPADSGLGITGTVPVAGRVLPPRKQGARTAATLPDGQAAILVDAQGQGQGRIILMPFPVVQSAQSMGVTDLFSLLLRSSVYAAAPELEDRGMLASEQLTITALSGTPEPARLIITLPPGAAHAWTSVPAAHKENRITFELTADTEPLKVLTLFQPKDPGQKAASIEVFTKCEGNFVSQGKAE